MKQSFKVRKDILSIDVDKHLILDLETLLLKKGGDYLSQNEEEVRKLFKIIIVDKYGQMEIGKINDYDLSTFADDVEEVNLRLYYDNYRSDRKIDVNIEFSKLRENSKIVALIEGEKCREIALGLIDGIFRILKTKRNFHFIYHPKSTWNIILAGIAIFLIYISTNFFQYQYNKTAVICLLLGLGYFLCYSIIRKLKPYSAFENSKQKSNDVIANFFVAGFIGFLVFGVFFTQIKNWLLN